MPTPGITVPAFFVMNQSRVVEKTQHGFFSYKKTGEKK